MKIPASPKTRASERKADSAIGRRLAKELEKVSERCVSCKLCQEECSFLSKYGKPKQIADSYDPSSAEHQTMPFECSLCRLCTAVCPAKIDPAAMFLEMRREMSKCGKGDYTEHAAILGYEKKGVSKRFSYYTLPSGCDTIFFPGCTLAGTRSEKVIRLYEHLRKEIPNIGLVLDCCTKPSHDLGRDDYFHKTFDEMKEYLLAHGIRNVLVACPNCHKVFKNFGGDVSVKTIYEIMARNRLPDARAVAGTVTIHDPCSVRFDEPVHKAVRDLVSARGLTIEEMPHHGTKTLCCGEGGSVGFLAPDLAKNWGSLRAKETDGRRIITYCAGCANYLGKLTPTSHVIDLIFEPEATLSGRVPVSRAPFTYLNRLRLKNHLKRKAGGDAVWERTLTTRKEGSRAGLAGRLILLLLIIAAIFTVRYTGATRYLDQETLRSLIRGYGMMAPAVYMLTYAIAPSIFLPGLPLTIAGGILFGPFWGVVYTITSATAGACIAFLISRYLARDWIEEKLRSPRWRRLDEGVERQGWKIVAFTRLVPLFPFNLLNYAFGLTKIRFLHYALATFICMLPACIAFIVFSSSLLDLLKGKVSPAFLLGLGLIALVSVLPVLYNRYINKNGLKGQI